MVFWGIPRPGRHTFLPLPQRNLLERRIDREGEGGRRTAKRRGVDRLHAHAPPPFHAWWQPRSGRLEGGKGGRPRWMMKCSYAEGGKENMDFAKLLPLWANSHFRRIPSCERWQICAVGCPPFLFLCKLNLWVTGEEL